MSEVDNGRALYELFVCISIGTALAEELLFRSALTAVLAQRRSMRIAIAAFAIVFGLWHVLPTIKSIESHPGGRAHRLVVSNAPQQSRALLHPPRSRVSSFVGCNGRPTACWHPP